MNTTSSVVLTAAVVAAGNWSQGKQWSIKAIVGMGVLAISLAALGEIDANLAQQFGVLVLVGAILIYGVDIAKGLGYRK